MRLIQGIRGEWQKLSPSRREVISTIFVFILAGAVAAIITLFGFQSYRVDGPSMQATLQDNDRLIIDKLPRTLARLSGHVYIPHRGDIIVFDQAGIGAPDTNKQLIKRVIGLPGERISISGGQVTVYNQTSPNGFDPDRQGWWQLSSSETSGQLNISLGANEIFVLGDNRPDSTDSRIFGPIKANQIIGKLVARIVPFNKAQGY